MSPEKNSLSLELGSFFLSVYRGLVGKYSGEPTCVGLKREREVKNGGWNASYYFEEWGRDRKNKEGEKYFLLF